MAKLLYLLGIISFGASFFASSTPQKMTTSNGEEVEAWDSSFYTHLHLALEPLLRAVEYATAKNDPNDQGDGFEVGQRKTLGRAVYSLPVSCGWFVIVASVLVQLRSRIAGGLVLAVVPLLALDFYRAATVYKGHFHLGLGAYFILMAYLAVGVSLSTGSVPPPLPGPGR